MISISQSTSPIRSSGVFFQRSSSGTIWLSDQGLVHGEDVGGLLWLVGAQAAGGVEHARRNVPAGARLQAVGLGQVGDLVVALREVLEARAHLVPGGAGGEAEEGVRVLPAVVVGLGREVVGLGLALLPGEGRVLVTVVDVVRQGALVVEELGVHRPALVSVPDAVADELPLQLRHRVAKQEAVGSGHRSRRRPR